jgi:hypothetical protein
MSLVRKVPVVEYLLAQAQWGGIYYIYKYALSSEK